MRGAERRGAGLETGVPGGRAAGRSGGRRPRPYAPCGWVRLRHARRARAERTHTAWNAGLQTGTAALRAAPVTKRTSLTGRFSRCNSCRDTHREERHRAGQGCAMRGAERRGAGLETGVPGRRAAGRSGGRWSRPYAPCGWVGLRHARRARAERTHTAWNAGLQTGTAALRAAHGTKRTCLTGRFSRCNSCRDTHREEQHRAGQGCAMRGAERRGAGLETGVPGGRAAGRSGGRRPRPYAPCGWVRLRHARRAGAERTHTAWNAGLQTGTAALRAAPVTKRTCLMGRFPRCNSCRDTHREERHRAGQSCATRGAERRGAGLETGVPGGRAAGRSGGRRPRPYAPCGWVRLRHARREGWRTFE